MNDKTNLVVAEPGAVSHDTSTAALLLDAGNMTRLMTVAEFMATGRATVPKHLQGNKGDCLAVAMQATQWRMNPFAVAQKTHLVNGTLGYESQLVVAAINTSGAIRGRLEWEWFGPWEKIVGKFKKVTSTKKTDEEGKPKEYIVPAWDFDKDEEGLGVHVRGILRGETEPRVMTLLMKQARTRNSTLWTEDPKQQLAYLASKRWGRLYTPEVILGVYSPDEFDTDTLPKNMGAAVVVDPVGSGATISAETLAEWKAAATQGKKAATAYWRKLPKETQALASEALKQEMWAIAEKADKERTVDVTPTPPAATQAPTPPSDAPSTGDTGHAEFVADMNAAEGAGNA